MSIFQVFKLFFLMLNIFALFSSLELALCYFIFGIVVVFCDFILKNRNRYFRFIFHYLVIIICLVFYIRPLVLIENPRYFQFVSNLGQINSTDVIEAMWLVTYYSIFILLFFTVCSKKSLGKSFSKEMFYRSRILIKLNYVINLLVFLSVLRFFINVLLGIGVKGQIISSSAAFLVRFAPEEFIIGISLSLLFFYRSILSKNQNIRLLLATILLLLSFLATGSKAVFLLLIMYFVFISMYMEIRIKTPKLILYSLLVMIFVPISFLLGNAVKFASYSGDLKLSGVVDVFSNLLSSVSFDEILNTTTSRLIGFDGMLAISKVDVSTLYEIFSITNTVERTIGMMVPFISSDLITSGEAVSSLVAGLPEDIVHAGAIGGYSGITLASNGYTFLGLIFFVLINIIIIKFLNQIEDPFSRLIQYFFYCFFILFTLMSGNFDFCIAIYLIKVILYKIYFYPVFKKN